MASSPVRIGLVGLDHWYSAFPTVDAITAHPDAELVAIADADPTRVREFAQRGGVERITADYRELVEDGGIDVIVSLISTDQNPEVCIAAAGNGKHLVSVKPLARTLAEASAIRAAVRDAGTLFIPMESQGRLSPHNAQLHEWYAEGRFGEIITASFSLWGGLPMRWPGDRDPGWWADPARSPGGGWIDHSIYHIDLMRWLLGREVAQISGVAANLKYPDLPVEDYGSAFVTFDGGAIATVEDTWHTAPGASRNSMGLVGTEGSLAYEGLTGRLSVSGAFPPFDSWVHTAPRSMQGDPIAHLVGAMRGEHAPVASVDDAWRNLSACLAFYEAARSGSVVAPEELPSD